ncbi:hypothetical protein [Streptomyces sp. NPDC050704]|uniref:hypothetical protein n=1 Tax=Streptomyces sp. NPDC050704 TaxID=3157219 RepID=UPI0034424542
MVTMKPTSQPHKIMILRRASWVLFAIGVLTVVALFVLLPDSMQDVFTDGSRDGRAREQQAAGSELAVVITAISGLVSAIGGACGGVAAIMLARRGQQPPAPAPAPPESGSPPE